MKRPIIYMLLGAVLCAGMASLLRVPAWGQPTAAGQTPVTNSIIGDIAVTPSDSVNVFGSGNEASGRAIYVDTAGTLHVTFQNGSQGTFASAATGAPIPWAVKRVWATGTSATGIHVQYKLLRGPISAPVN